MFKTLISSPISPLTPSYFSKHTRIDTEPGYALSCLGAALFQNRIENYPGMKGKIDGRLYREENMENEIVSSLMAREDVEAVSAEDGTPQTVTFLYYIVPKIYNFDSLSAKLCNHGLCELNKVETYVKQEIPDVEFRAFNKPEKNEAVILVTDGDSDLYHLSLAFLYVYYPNIFRNKQLTRDEIDLLKSFTSNNIANFRSAFAKVMAPMKNELMRTELSDLFVSSKMARVQQAEANVEQARVTVNRLLAQYREQMSVLEGYIIQYEGLKIITGNGMTEQESNFIDYLCSNPALSNITFNNNKLMYVAKTQLVNFDRQKWRAVVGPHDIFNGYTIPDDNPFHALQARKTLLTAMFDTDDPDLTVNMVGRIHLNVAANWMEVSNGDVSLPETENALTNPHFKYHGCPGRNRDQIIECLSRGELVSAVECSIAATGSVNIAETEYTFRRMVQEILTSNKKIIHRRDGVDLTPAEALLWLIKKQEGKAA